MESLGINTSELHVAEYRLAEEAGRNARLVLLFLEVGGEQLLGTPKHTDVHDVVVIDMVHLYPIVAV